MAKSKGKQIAGGGRKGGTRFPQYSLRQLLPNLKDLTSKTHTKPITVEQLNSGVFKIKPNSGIGLMKFSSLKQFFLAKGEYKAITATTLATNIVLADSGQKIKLFREAVLNVPSFKNAFETFQDSTISKSKIKEYAVQSLKVHLDSSDKFVEAFVDSGEEAKLCSVKGDQITFISSKDIDEASTKPPSKEVPKDEESFTEFADDGDLENDMAGEEQNEEDEFDSDESVDDENDSAKNQNIKRAKPNISIQVDSTLDPDKLSKQLRLLKKYGLI